MNVAEAERTHAEELEELGRPPREEKVAEVQRLLGIIKESRGVYLTDFRGINVERMNELRSKFREQGVQYTIVKNNLLKLAADEAGLSEWVAGLEGPTALAIGTEDPVAPAKVIRDFQEEHKREADYLAFKGGLLAGEPIEVDTFTRLATLPSREELIAKLLYLLTYPMRGLVTVLSGVPRALVYALEDYRKQRIEGGETPEPPAGEAPAEGEETEASAEEAAGAEDGTEAEAEQEDEAEADPSSGGADDEEAKADEESKEASADADGAETGSAEAQEASADESTKAAEAGDDGGEPDAVEAEGSADDGGGSSADDGGEADADADAEDESK
jgi:large subunit ribosomal protein L10